MGLTDTYTSTGSKLFHHQEAMAKLRNGQGQPITTHVMLTDVCNHKCAFCSVQAREGDTLEAEFVLQYLTILKRYGLKSVILSGGGNPILYRSRGYDFNNIVADIYEMGLEIGLITNGIPMKVYTDSHRESWKTVAPETLDRLTWVRISMSGLDHPEEDVYVPDIDPTKTTLGFSYVGHDIYLESADPHHGKVSTRADILSGPPDRAPDFPFESRMSKLTLQISEIARAHRPAYVRLLPNCLEPPLIPARVRHLQAMAYDINLACGREVAFVQNKPPSAPKACYLGYVHPVLNCDGYVYPCDSCVLNEAADHSFKKPWRVCRWDEVAKLYEQPVRSLIADPSLTCPGCVFPTSNGILGTVVDGTADLTPPNHLPEHVNFV